MNTDPSFREDDGREGARSFTVTLRVDDARVLRKVIDRITTPGKEGKKPGLLKPLRERAPQALGNLISERREQRAPHPAASLLTVASATSAPSLARMVRRPGST